MKEPKILYFDIETSHCLAFVWGCGQQYVSAEQIKKERKILSICYLWSYERDDQVHRLKMDMSKHNINAYDDDADKAMLIKFMEVVSKADLIVAHNGSRFDIARIRARLVKYELPDITPVLVDDSYTFSKDIDFTSHKLDYIGRYLGTPRKTHVPLSIWMRIMEGDRKALNELVEYNANDVVALRPIYQKLRPYCKSKLNFSIFKEVPNGCPNCGKPSLFANGWRYTQSGKYQRLQCKECGAHARTTKASYTGGMRK